MVKKQESKDRIINLEWASRESVSFEELKPGMLVWVGEKYELRPGMQPNMSPIIHNNYYRDYSSFCLGLLKYCRFTQEIGNPNEEKKMTRKDVLDSFKNIKVGEPKLPNGKEYNVILQPAISFEQISEIKSSSYKVNFLEHLVEAKGEIALPGNDFIKAVYESAPDLLIKLRIDTYQHLFVNDKIVPLGDTKYLGSRKPVLLSQEEKENLEEHVAFIPNSAIKKAVKRAYENAFR